MNALDNGGGEKGNSRVIVSRWMHSADVVSVLESATGGNNEKQYSVCWHISATFCLRSHQSNTVLAWPFQISRSLVLL